MTGLDRFEGRPGARDGYWPSAWPAECGGNRRQKAAVGRLDAATGTASVAGKRNGRWNVMFVEREPDQWYLGGTMPAFSGPEPYGWVERLDLSAGGADAEILEPVAASPRLPCGDHVWCGSILAHANGAVYSVNGSTCTSSTPTTCRCWPSGGCRPTAPTTGCWLCATAPSSPRTCGSKARAARP